ncbi:hypothetical protein OQA88_753 [Cercophora sp. LCS_1]
MAILNLPDELLLDIFGHLFTQPPSTIPSDPETKRHRPDGAALPKVSRRFHRLATPGLYTHLDVNFNDSPSSATQLHRTLSEHPSLRPYCRSLRLTLPDPDADAAERDGDMTNEELSQAATSMATDITTWLSNTRDLSITGYFTRAETHAASWALVQHAGRNMPQLETLSLGKQVWVERVCELLSEFKQLRTLEIGLGCVVEDIIPPTPELVGSSAVTSLSIDYLLAVPGNLDRLLLIPAALEHFAFRGMAPGCYWSWPLAGMIEALEPHRESLRTFKIASARASGNQRDPETLEDQVQDIDLSGFVRLGGIEFLAAP